MAASASRRQAHALRAESHRLHAQAVRLEDAADRLDPMGLRYEPPEDDRGAYHDKMAAYWRSRAAGKSCEEAEDESEKLGEVGGPSHPAGVIEPGAAS